MLTALVLFAIAACWVSRMVQVVPQQQAWVVERMGKYASTLQPGLSVIVPFVERVAYKHSLKEIPLAVQAQRCATLDDLSLQVEAILYFQVIDAVRASYGTSNYVIAISQLAQSSLRQAISKLELKEAVRKRYAIDAQVVAAIDEPALNWGLKVLRFEINDLTPST